MIAELSLIWPEDFGRERTRLARHPEKVVSEEEEEDEEEKAEGNDEEYEFNSFLQATFMQMRIQQPLHLDALWDIQVTLQHRKFMMTKIYGRLFLDEGMSGGRGG